MNTVPWVVWLVPCAFIWGCKTGPEPRKEYSFEFTLEVNGKIVERQTGIVREVEPKK